MRMCYSDKKQVSSLLLHKQSGETDNKIEKVLTRLDGDESESIEGFFFDMQIFDANTIIADIIRKIKRE